MEQDSNEININFKELFGILKKEIWVILGLTILFAILGIVYAYSLKEEFISEGRILPEAQAKGGASQYASLAALAGVDLGGSAAGSDAVRPDLYPDVLKTTPFFLNLLQVKFRDRFEKNVVFKAFFENQILDGKIKNTDQKPKYSSSDQYTVLDLETERAIKNLKQRIVCTYDKKTGVIVISVKLPDPVVAAGVARFGMNYLTDYIINYRIEKQKRDLNFLAERLAAAKGKYYNNQTQKATYTDQMPLSALRLQSADLQRERIESEYRISSTFYNTLLQKYEEAKLKMQQETPVIQVLEPPVVPNNKSEPKKSFILMGFLIFGLLIGLLVSLLKSNNFKKIILSDKR
jgi:uncharacterized protein involved in exopolysaccharide biosynthesis